MKAKGQDALDEINDKISNADGYEKNFEKVKAIYKEVLGEMGIDQKEEGVTRREEIKQEGSKLAKNIDKIGKLLDDDTIIAKDGIVFHTFKELKDLPILTKINEAVEKKKNLGKENSGNESENAVLKSNARSMTKIEELQKSIKADIIEPKKEHILPLNNQIAILKFLGKKDPTKDIDKKIDEKEKKLDKVYKELGPLEEPSDLNEKWMDINKRIRTNISSKKKRDKDLKKKQKDIENQFLASGYIVRLVKNMKGDKSPNDILMTFNNLKVQDKKQLNQEIDKLRKKLKI